jgi:hypothetical protein
VLLLVFAGLLPVLAIAGLTMQYFFKLRVLAGSSVGNGGWMPPAAARYRPMLRLLSDDDIAFASSDKRLVKKLRAQRNRLFRDYLRCLTKDYGRLLAGIRLAMVNSGVDRPDLARALAANQTRFALALCRIECRVFLHQFGIGKVDISGLVDAIDVLRAQVSILTPVALSAR